MKIVMAWVMVALSVMACGVQFADQSPKPSMTASSPVSSPTNNIRIVIMVTPSAETMINAPEGVRLRDRPDAAGPVDSIELTVMHTGDAFIVQSCNKVNNHWWAYGTFHTSESLQDFIDGWVIADYLSPNPCGAK